ncbi:MAG TPA: hypothetical protein VE504_06930 [Nitrososphaeraceae archaeon]|nr:hypothetical protein [Nitrososphaeraceae archaeon]
MLSWDEIALYFLSYSQSPSSVHKEAFSHGTYEVGMDSQKAFD